MEYDEGTVDDELGFSHKFHLHQNNKRTSNQYNSYRKLNHNREPSRTQPNQNDTDHLNRQSWTNLT